MKTFLARRWMLSLTTLALVLALALAWGLLSNALRPVGLYTGWLLLGLVLLLTFFNARKKLPFLPILNASTWLQIHVYAGWITCFVFVLHTGARLPGGRLEFLLWLCFIVVAASGISGLWLSRWLPPRLARSGESLIYEQIPLLRHRLETEAKALVHQANLVIGSTTVTVQIRER